MTPASPQVNQVPAACRELTRRWHGEIPVSAAMGIAVAGFDGTAIHVTAALEPNVNVHGTAFAGSLFSVASLTGWGLVHLILERQGLAGSIVFVDGRIRCLAPVRDRIDAHCRWPDTADAVLGALPEHRRGRFHLDVAVTSAGILAAEFSGEYAVRLTQPDQ